MKKIKLLLSLLILAQITSAQVNWTKYSNNPVMTKGGSTWEALAIGQPTCLYENDTIKMWYAGVDGNINARIFYAWSINGINWNKYNNATPVIDISSSGWDTGWLDAPEVVNDGQYYRIYFYGDTTQQSPEISSSYGTALSSDGINWVKYPNNPVLTKGDSLEFDGKWIESPAVIYNEQDSVFMMWYTGMGWNWQCKNGLAYSFDGISWNKYANNPVTNLGPSGSFDDMWVAVPAVIKTDDIYEMWYCGFSSVSSFDTIQTGYAVSLDGISWIKYTGNPVYSQYFTPYDTLNDADGPWAPDIVFNPNTNEYLMLYEGTSGIQLAKAPRNIIYSPYCSINISNDTTIVAGMSVQLAVNGGNEYHWYPELGLSSPDISNPVASPFVTTKYKVLIVSDSCITIDSVTITVVPLGIKEVNNKLNVSVFPNPMIDFTSFQFDNPDLSPISFTLYNCFGQIIYERKNIRAEEFLLKRSEITPGMYFFKITDSIINSAVGKLILQ